jgi:hypothetical protein
MGKPLLSAQPRAGIRERGRGAIFFETVIYSKLEKDSLTPLAYSAWPATARRRTMPYPSASHVDAVPVAQRHRLARSRNPGNHAGHHDSRPPRPTTSAAAQW